MVVCYVYKGGERCEYYDDEGNWVALRRFFTLWRLFVIDCWLLIKDSSFFIVGFVGDITVRVVNLHLKGNESTHLLLEIKNLWINASKAGELEMDIQQAYFLDEFISFLPEHEFAENVR